MENKIVNNIFLTFFLAFLGFNTGLYLFSIYNVSVIIFLLLFVIALNFLFKYYKIKEKILNIIDFPMVKVVILFILLLSNSKNNIIDMTFINGGLFFMVMFYILYDNEYIKYKLTQKKKNKDNKNVSKY